MIPANCTAQQQTRVIKIMLDQTAKYSKKLRWYFSKSDTNKMEIKADFHS